MRGRIPVVWEAHKPQKDGFSQGQDTPYLSEGFFSRQGLP